MTEEAQKKVNYRIGMAAAVFMIGFGLLLDGSEIILDLAGTLLGGVGVVLGVLVDILKFTVLPTLFVINRAPFWKGKKVKKKIASMAAAFIIGFIPWVGAAAPETAIGTAVTVYLTRKEDKEKAGEDTMENKIGRNITRAKRIRAKIRK